MSFFRKNPFFIRLFHWEYWSFNAVYGPIYILWFWFCIKTRSFFFFNTANPSIRNGGFLMDSKKEIYDLIPQEYYPKTLFFKKNSEPKNVLEEIQQHGMQYPLIGKPDIGMKALRVKKLESEQELVAYCLASKVDFLIQECADYPLEAGIFYYRYPDEKDGKISGIVSKKFLSVTGNGKSSIYELIMENPRALLQLNVLEKTYKEKIEEVLDKDEEFVLVPYGSHFRGSEFRDDSHLAGPEITALMNTICKKVDGFYYGRMDIRFSSWEDLRNGKNFSVIELNGAGSEPTHMYDPRHSIFFAWKEIIRHWNILYKISKQNHRLLKIPYMTTKEGLEMFRQNREYVKLIST